jgi:hypothetical protein
VTSMIIDRVPLYTQACHSKAASSGNLFPFLSFIQLLDIDLDSPPSFSLPLYNVYHIAQRTFWNWSRHSTVLINSPFLQGYKHGRAERSRQCHRYSLLGDSIVGSRPQCPKLSATGDDRREHQPSHGATATTHRSVDCTICASVLKASRTRLTKLAIVNDLVKKAKILSADKRKAAQVS